MKILVCLFLMIISTSSWARICTITFDNEISQDPALYSLYNIVVENKAVLLRKGYRLISVTDGASSHSAYIFKEDNYRLLFQGTANGEMRTIETQFISRTTAVLDLLKKIPACQK